MRYRPPKKAWIIILATLVILLTLMFPGSSWGQIGVEVVNFFSGNSSFLGEPVPVGTTIATFDPDSVQCGEFVVQTPGQYGLLSCRRDDSTTAEDEGAEPGDQIFFTIGGLPAAATPISFNGNPVSPDSTVTWTSNGDLWEVDLEVADGDSDGIPDGNECPGVINPQTTPQPCPDTDSDGVPDFLDADSDDDGIPDAQECPAGPPCPDTDSDGAPDYLDTDSDDDGIPDARECPAGPPCPDSDGDGIPDFLEPPLRARPVGGYAYPISALELLAPWLMLAAALTTGGGIAMWLVRRHLIS